MTVPTPDIPLFVPGDRPERVPKAIAAGADGVIVDLEDAVAPDRKAAARCDIPGDRSGVVRLLRINDAGTPWHPDDLAFAAGSGFDGVVLPKAEDAATVDAVRSRLRGGAAVVALVETARGLSAAGEIAAAADRLAFGSLDYAEDMGCAHTRQALLFARCRLVEAARLAAKPPPLDGVTAAAHDAEAASDDAAHAAQLGFGGKLLIHPRQIEPVRAAFRPDRASVEWAERVLRAFA